MFGIDYWTLLSIRLWLADRFETPIYTPNTGTRNIFIHFSLSFVYMNMHAFNRWCYRSEHIGSSYWCVHYSASFCLFFSSSRFSFLSHILFCSWHFNVYYLLRFLHRFWMPFSAFMSSSTFCPSFCSLFFFFVSHFCNSLGLKLYHQHRHAISIVTTSFQIGCIFWSGQFLVATSFELCVK